MVEAARKTGMRIVGPNSQGLANFGTGAIAASRRCSWIWTAPKACRDAQPERRIEHGPRGILAPAASASAIPCYRNDADISVGELAVAVAEDPEVKLLTALSRSIPEKNISKNSPLWRSIATCRFIALKSGRSEAGRQRAIAHRRLANEDRVVDAFFETSRHLARA